MKLVVLLSSCVLSAAANPSGLYKGSKIIFGQSIDASIAIDDGAHLDLDITATKAINCAKEAYTFNNHTLNLTTSTTAGDCIHDALQQYQASITSITYDTTADSLSVAVKAMGLPVILELNKSAAARGTTIDTTLGAAFWAAELKALPTAPAPAPPAAFRFATSQSDDMILQMAPLQATVWGFAAEGAAVSVGFNGQTIAASAGKWLGEPTWIATLPATAGSVSHMHNITATSEGVTITLSNILFGEVYVCSGQVSVCV